MTPDKPLADAEPRHWTAALPDRLLAFAQLSRFDRPIGWRLLLLPCWMGIAIVRIQDGFWPDDAIRAIAFFFGAILMRGAGCTYNDIVDVGIDAKVERTRGRPLPSGRVTRLQAWLWLAAQCALGLVALLMLPRFAQLVAVASLPLVAVYPFMKRVTWWPQAWLGIVFSWGALVGGAATSNSLMPETMLLYVGCFFWVIAYDTIYALQDKEDDALVGVRSTARLFAERWREWTLGFYAAALFFWAAAAYVAGAPWATFAALAVVGVVLIWPALQGPQDAKPETALAAFKANALVGMGVVIALALEPLWLNLRPMIGG
ncbi:MAG: 4-hydroxybenzoate octaprenyltransferase [Hyphomonadaceae bacterium]|nr:4-hydroxybenzoate octaprenyltransferase [Hyphomonadaceae bacterium]